MTTLNVLPWFILPMSATLAWAKYTKRKTTYRLLWAAAIASVLVIGWING